MRRAGVARDSGMAALVEPGRALFVPTAANGPPDRAAITEAFRRRPVETLVGREGEEVAERTLLEPGRC